MRLAEGPALWRAVRHLCRRKATISAGAERRASRIVAEVRKKGDRALRSYAQKLDGVPASVSLAVSPLEMQAAADSISGELRRALQAAAANIRRFCEWQCPQDWLRESQPGLWVGQTVRPLQSVACYVPGGRHPLPSSLLMTVIPAQVAGVQRIVVASPRPSREVLAAAHLLHVSEFYRIGGAQAVAALAYGTRSIGSVDKIVGPGNAYVTAAKKSVAFDCGIDFLAGPTEAIVLSENGNARYIAADLLAQAEHDPNAVAVLVTTSRALAGRVMAELRKLSRANPVAAQALRRNGHALVAQDREEALEIANAIAPEHISVPPEALPCVCCAGSIFIGEHSPQAVGDYFAGPNHVLPTGGGARLRGGLTVLDFVKVISVQRVERDALRRIAGDVEVLARAEGLTAHAESVRVRCVHA
jgi:histidinol dehydrogenase